MSGFRRYSIGQMVQSTAGRDCNQIYVVIGVDDSSNQLLLADGREQKIAKPKKKNIRHVKALNYIAESVAKKLAADHRVTDEDLRQAINNIKPDNL